MRTLCFALTIAFLAIGVHSKADNQKIDFLQQDRYAPASFGIPANIGEYDVFTILTNDNFACMRPGEKRLVLKTQEPKMEDALSAFSKQRLQRDLKALNLAKQAQWGFDLVGPGITQQQLVGHFAESYSFFKTNPCIRVRSPLRKTTLSEPGGEDRRAPPYPGFAIIENVDAGDYIDDNAQSVFFIAPVVGTNQEGKEYSALLNNVKTDKEFFLQVGFTFQESAGYVVWTDSAVDLVGQVMPLPGQDNLPPDQQKPLPYKPNHLYGTLISFTNGIWWMCAGDYENVDDTWSCHAELKEAIGTNLQKTIETSVFAENWNSKPEWVSGFSNPWTAFGAKLYRNGVAQDWASQEAWTLHTCRDHWLPENVIYGSLAHGGRADFGIIGLPLYCE